MITLSMIRLPPIVTREGGGGGGCVCVGWGGGGGGGGYN